MHLIVPESFKKYCSYSPTPQVMNQDLQEAVGSRGVEPSYARFSKAAPVILTSFPSGNIPWLPCYTSPRLISPKVHALLALSVDGAQSACQFSCLARLNPKPFKEARSWSKVLHSLFTIPILNTDGRTYLYKQYVSGAKWWGWGWAEMRDPIVYSANAIVIPKSSCMPMF